MGKHALRPPSRWPQHLLLVWVLGTAGLGLLVAAGLLGLIGMAGGPSLPSVGVLPQTQPVPSAAAQSVPAPSRPETPSATSVPTRLKLPSSGIDAPVVPVTVLPGGGLEVPDNPRMLGWWHDGAHPGSHLGTVVIVGHVDTARDGAGALFQLSQARPGQQVVLDTDEGPQRYVITALRSYSKSDLPAEVFATTGRARLVMITCGGPFDTRTRQYADNVVAYAVSN